MILLLFVPLRAKLTLSATLHGGRGLVNVRFLCIGTRVPVRIHILEAPTLSVEILKDDGRTRLIKRIAEPAKKPPGKWSKAAKQAIRLPKAAMTMMLGVGECPATTALLCGTVKNVLYEAMHILLPDVETQIDAVPVWNQTMFRINLESIASVRLAEIIRERIFIRSGE